MDETVGVYTEVPNVLKIVSRSLKIKGVAATHTTKPKRAGTVT